MVRRRRLQLLFVDGHGVAEVARQLNVSVRTVQRDLVAVRQENAARQGVIDRHELGEWLYKRYLARGRRARAIAEERLDDPWVQLRILAFEQADDAQIVELLQSLGMVPRAPVKVPIEVRIFQVISSLKPEEWEALEGMDDPQYAEWLSQRGLLDDAAGAPAGA